LKDSLSHCFYMWTWKKESKLKKLRKKKKQSKAIYFCIDNQISTIRTCKLLNWQPFCKIWLWNIYQKSTLPGTGVALVDAACTRSSSLYTRYCTSGRRYRRQGQSSWGRWHCTDKRADEHCPVDRPPPTDICDSRMGLRRFKHQDTCSQLLQTWHRKILLIILFGKIYKYWNH